MTTGATLCLTWQAGKPCLLLPHGRKGTPAAYAVRLVPGGAVLTSPAGAVYEVRDDFGRWTCGCPAWRYGGQHRCKHSDSVKHLYLWLFGQGLILETHHERAG
jgi:hypothetical protein